MNMVKANIGPSTATSAVMTHFARSVIRVMGLLSCLSLLIVTLFVGSSVTFLLIVAVFIGISLFAVYMVTGKRRIYYSPVIFMLFYIIGYILAFADTLLHKGKLHATGWFAIGSFGFTDEEWLQVFFVIAFGLAGMLCAVLLFEAICKRKHILPRDKISAILYERRNTAKLLVTLWLLFSVMMISTALVLGIGKHGVAEQRRLPFKLIGLLLYIKGYIIPFVGFMLMGVFVRNDQRKLRNIVIFLLIGSSIVSSLAFYGRSTVIMTVFIIFLYFSMNVGKYNISAKRLAFYLGLAIPVVAMTIYLVTIVRTAAYSQITSGTVGESVISRQFNLNKALSFVSSFVLLRTEGIRTLLAVASSPLRGLQLTWGMFIGDKDITYRIYRGVFGFVPTGPEGTAYGITVGLWGLLFTSKSYIVVFAGTMLYTSFSLFVEELFRRKGLHAGALFFAVYIGLLIWMNMVWFFLIRIVAMVMLAYFLIRFIENRYYKPAFRI